jgi:hypothetical protein
MDMQELLDEIQEIWEISDVRPIPQTLLVYYKNEYMPVIEDTGTPDRPFIRFIGSNMNIYAASRKHCQYYPENYAYTCETVHGILCAPAINGKDNRDHFVVNSILPLLNGEK